MALLFSENFDAYTPTNSLVGTDTEPTSSGKWTVQGTYFGGGYAGASSLVTQYNAGNSWWLYNAYLAKLNLATTANTMFASFSLRSNTTFTGSLDNWAEFYFYDGSEKQLTICFCNDASIRVRRGSGTGTLVAVFQNALVSQQWEQWQIKVVFNDTTGAVYLRKNGATTDTFSITNVDTKATANSYANGIGIAGIYPSIAFFDNINFWSGAGVAPNDWQNPPANSGNASAAGYSAASAISGGGPTPCSNLSSETFGVLRVYADGRLVLTRELVRSGDMIRLPSGFKAQFWQVEIEARAKVYSVQMGTSAKELRGV